MPRHVYNVIKDTPDVRDCLAPFPDAQAHSTLPDTAINSSKMPAVENQGQEGSCTGNGWAAMLDYACFEATGRYLDPSRQFIYGQERKREGTFGQDGGAQVRSGGIVCCNYGAPPEPLWPYDPAHFALEPTADIYLEAMKHRLKEVQRVAPTPESICYELSQGRPVVIGFTVYEGFESAVVAQTGLLELPKKQERSMGGHCVVICDYVLIQRAGPHGGVLGPLFDRMFGQNQIDGYWVVRNSWGGNWGLPTQPGYFRMPFSYARHDLIFDCWTQRGLLV